MAISVSHLRQIALQSSDLARSIRFYQTTLGAELIATYDPPGLAFFRLGETRLMVQHAPAPIVTGTVLYFAVADIHAAFASLKAAGVRVEAEPHAIYRDEQGTFGPAGEEEWMAFFKDPDGHMLALASRRPASAVKASASAT